MSVYFQSSAADRAGIFSCGDGLILQARGWFREQLNIIRVENLVIMVVIHQDGSTLSRTGR